MNNTEIGRLWRRKGLQVRRAPFTEPDPDRRLLVMPPRATAHLRHLAAEGEIDVIAVNEAQTCATTWPATHPLRPAPTLGRRDRKPWVRWGLARMLLSNTAQIQHRLAEMLGLPAGGLTRLGTTPGGAAHRARLARRVPEELLAEYLTAYPGPGGAVTDWYGLDPVIAQATAAADFCTRQEVAVLVSGDATADVYAPWRLSTRAMLYTDRFVDLSAAGISPATEAEHTLAVQIPADPTLWHTAEMDEPILLPTP